MKNIILILVILIAGLIFYIAPNKTSNVKDAITGTSDETSREIPNSKTIDLSNQNLTRVPDSIFNQTNAEELNLSNNSFTGALPSQVQKLQNLRVLNLSNNKFTGVPAEVGQLADLEILDLSNNMITGLPNEIGNLKNLKVLNLSGNKYSVQNLTAIRANLSASVKIIVE